MNILADVSLPGLSAAFPYPFKLSYYHSFRELPELLSGQDVLLCRSTLKVNSALLTNHSVRFVATASSGTDHLDHQFLKSKNIQMLDAKGCNATAVADYIVSCLAYLDEQLLINGNKAAIIGMGMVGSEVCKRLQSLNFDIYPYDPLRALQDNQFTSCNLKEIVDCDLICIHAELHHNEPHPSFDLFDEIVLKQLKPGCIIINAARGGIVNEESILGLPKQIIYCTDVYLNEPAIDKRIIDKSTLCTPHIAGHSLEAKYKAVELISKQLHRIMKLPLPVYDEPELTESIQLNRQQSWQQLMLSLYNPFNETLGLKNAKNKELAFITLRKNHQYRHDFKRYFDLF